MSKSNIYRTLATSEQSGKINPELNEQTGYSTLSLFLHHIDAYGVLILNNFEVSFSGISDIKFFINQFEMPGSKLNTCEIFYDGIKIVIPVNYEHDHEFSMTILNDMQGYIYSAFKSYIELDSYNHYSSSGETMIIKVLTGQVSIDGIVAYGGAVIKCKGVRLTTISGLQYGQDNNNILTFTVQGFLIEYSHLPTDISKKVN